MSILPVTKVSDTGASKRESQQATTFAHPDGQEPPVSCGADYERGSATEVTGTYGPTVEAMKHEAEARYQHLRELVENLITRQRGKYDKATATQNEVPPEIRQEAQREIGPGGYYSPEVTAKRIVDFAKALSGNDKTKYNLLRDAMEEGFAAAEAKLGGTLPDISQKTYELVQQGFDEWAKELGLSVPAESV